MDGEERGLDIRRQGIYRVSGGKTRCESVDNACACVNLVDGMNNQFVSMKTTCLILFTYSPPPLRSEAK